MWPQFLLQLVWKHLLLPLAKGHLSNVATISWQTGWPSLLEGDYYYMWSSWIGIKTSGKPYNIQVGFCWYLVCYHETSWLGQDLGAKIMRNTTIISSRIHVYSHYMYRVPCGYLKLVNITVGISKAKRLFIVNVGQWDYILYHYNTCMCKLWKSAMWSMSTILNPECIRISGVSCIVWESQNAEQEINFTTQSFFIWCLFLAIWAPKHEAAVRRESLLVSMQPCDPFWKLTAQSMARNQDNTGKRLRRFPTTH